MFDGFLASIREALNDQISEADLVAMVAQHMVTLPVFDALFADSGFAERNPVSRGLNELVAALDEHGLRNETRDLEGFYESVRRRVDGLTDPDGRLRVLLELYENFFAKALPGETKRLGIVYTPLPVVDFILRSAEAVSRREFDRGLTDEDVHVIDPFTGTGTFINRLLTLPGLIADEDLARKYGSGLRASEQLDPEVHANEVVLLAYYIAAAKIEEGHRSRQQPGEPYQPFEGIVLTDTFEMLSHQQQLEGLMRANSRRAERQRQLPIQVVVGNPPWSAGQSDASDDTPNVPHLDLEQRVRETYVERSTAQNKNQMYDTYKLAFRWASDRIGERGSWPSSPPTRSSTATPRMACGPA